MTRLIGSDGGPTDDDAAGASAEHDPNADRRTAGAGRRQRTPIPSEEECLAALNHLAGAVALGFVKPAQAAAMRANYVEILKFHRGKDRASAGPAVADADVLELLRQNPRLLAILEPFLTEKQVDLVMKKA